MRILYISSLFPPSIGGGENYVKWTAEKLAGWGEDVSVFTANALHGEFKRVNSLPPEEVVNGVYVRRFPVNRWANSLCSHKTDKFKGAYRIKSILFGETMGFWQHGPIIDGMMEAIKRHSPDVIVAVNNYFYTTYLAYMAKEELGIPLVIVPLSHTSDPWAEAPVLKKIYNNTDAVIVSTNYEKSFLIQQGTYQGNIYILPHGIDPKEFNDADGKRFRSKYHLTDDPLVSFIGRKVNGKGVDTLIKAMRLVWKEFKDAQLALLGPDGNCRLFHQELSELTLEEKLKTLNIDHFPDEEKKDIFAASDVFAMPSRIDSFGLVYLEAWRNAVPVIACSNTAQESYMRNGEDSLLVDYGNAEQLAQALLLLLKDRDLRHKVGQQGQRKFFKSHTLDIYVRDLRDILMDVTDARGDNRLETPELSSPGYSLKLSMGMGI